MDFRLTEEEQAIQATFHRFAQAEVRPRARELDETRAFPRDLFRRVGELGLYALRYPDPQGRRGSTVACVLALEELAWGSLSLAAACTMQSLMATYFLHKFAPDTEKARLLVPAFRGEAIGAICMTESGAGSDLGAVATRAVERGGRFHLTGAKTWVTSAPVADFFTVVASTGDKELGVFLVERGAPGLEIGRVIEKAGVRASLTAELFFEDTPATCRLGPPGGGMAALKEILPEIRVATAGLALGVARAAFEEARAWARERRQFGRPIREFQAIGIRLADMAVDLEAARRLTYYSAWRSDQGLSNMIEASIAKLFASEAAVRICDNASRVVASYGFAEGNPVERYLRDVRFTLFGGGTSEILRVNLAREL
jgi:butyryl-CoA dehydrogenase